MKTIHIKTFLAFIIFSFWGLVLNTSSFTAIQNIFLMSSLAVVWVVCILAFKGKLRELTNITPSLPTLAFSVTSGFAAFFWLQSLTLTPVAQALFLISSIPIVALLIEIFVFKEKTNRLGILAIAIGMLGIAILLSDGLQSGKEFLSLGSVFVLIAVCLIVAQGFLIKKLEKSYSLDIVIFIIAFSQVVVSGFFVWTVPWDINTYSIASALFLSLFPALIAVYFYSEALRALKVSTVRLIGYIEVFLGSLWGIIFLSQPLLPMMLVGGLLILLASYLAVKSGE